MADEKLKFLKAVVLHEDMKAIKSVLFYFNDASGVEYTFGGRTPFQIDKSFQHVIKSGGCIIRIATLDENTSIVTGFSVSAPKFAVDFLRAGDPRMKAARVRCLIFGKNDCILYDAGKQTRLARA